MVDRDDTPTVPPVGTPGSLIRQARQRNGLSLEILFQETRIPVRLLEAIERDDFDQLSGPLYARSFLRTLARTLGLEEQHLLSMYERFLKEEEPTVPPDQTWEEEVSVEKIGLLRTLPVGILLRITGAVIAVVLAVWLAVSLLGGGKNHQMAAGRSTPVTDLSRQTTDTVSAAPMVADTTSVKSPASSPVEVAHPATPSVAVAPVTLPDSSAVEAMIVRPDPTELAVLSALPAGTAELEFVGGRHFPLVLRIVTREKIALAVAVDAERHPTAVDWTRSDIPGLPHSGIVPGRVYAVGRRYVIYWGAEDHFVVRLGASDGVTVTLNDRPLVISRRQLGNDWVIDATFLAGQ